MSDDDESPDPPEGDTADLEDTMRLGLEEIANEAPRGKNVWDTTASMIAIHVEQVAKDDPTMSVPPVPTRTSEVRATPPAPPDDPGPAQPVSRTLVLAALIALVLVAIALTILLATR